MRPAPADSVGHSVPQITARKPRVANGNKPLPATTLTDEWLEVATIDNQISDPSLWRLEKEKVEIFDLSKPSELEAYNALLTKSSMPNTNTIISDSSKEFAEQTGNWKVFVRYSIIQYRKLLIAKKEPQVTP